METLSDKHLHLKIPEFESKQECKVCGVINNTQFEILNHNTGANHTKKLRMQIRSQCKCMLCSGSFADTKAATSHIQNYCPLRTNQNAKPLNYLNTMHKCLPCRIVFGCNIASEMHMVMKHDAVLSQENLPELSDLVRSLYGSTSDHSNALKDPECQLCSIKSNDIDGYLIHLLSQSHLETLRVSGCLACDKKFIHVSDREAHLMASKHISMSQKLCLQKKVQKVENIKEKNGYFCMYCMVWCSSWPCYVIHLVGNNHKVPQEEPLQMQEDQVNEDFRTPECVLRWKKWVEESSAMSSWCLVCNEVLSHPEALEKHLGDHDLDKVSLNRCKGLLEGCHDMERSSDLEICGYCSVVFRDGFSLAVHKTHKQHHVFTALVLNDGNLCKCPDCMPRCRNSDKVVSATMYGEKCTKALSNNAMNECKKVGDGIRVLSECKNGYDGSSGTRAMSECKNMDNGSTKLVCDWNFNEVIESSKPLEAFVKNNACSQKSLVKDKEMLPDHTRENPDLALGSTDHVKHVNEESMNVNTELEKVNGIPMVVAAAIPTSTLMSVEKNLESVVDVVSKTLLEALEKIRKSQAQEFTANKRLKPSSCCDMLESALGKGMQSLGDKGSTDKEFNESNKSAACSSFQPYFVSSADISNEISVVIGASIIHQSPRPQVCSQPSPVVAKQVTFKDECGQVKEQPCLKDSTSLDQSYAAMDTDTEMAAFNEEEEEKNSKEEQIEESYVVVPKRKSADLLTDSKGSFVSKGHVYFYEDALDSDSDSGDAKYFKRSQ